MMVMGVWGVGNRIGGVWREDRMNEKGGGGVKSVEGVVCWVGKDRMREEGEGDFVEGMVKWVELSGRVGKF